MNNQTLCKHEKLKYAHTINKVGFSVPEYFIVLFCEKCGKLKTQKVKLPKRK